MTEKDISKNNASVDFKSFLMPMYGGIKTLHLF
jgi:hypothetical protein